MQRPNSKFLKIICSKCENEQIIFNKSSSDVNCLVCGSILAEKTGGKSVIKSKIVKVLG